MLPSLYAAMGLQSHRYAGPMARWEPDARNRIVVAGLELFTEQGYDQTTVAQIAERARITKSTFFRHFPDKRELLSAGQETLARLFAEGIAEAPDDAGPLAAVAAGLLRATGHLGPFNHEIGARVSAAIAASAELQERAMVKHVGLAAAMAQALIDRGVPEATAQLAAEIGVLAFKRGFAAWVADARADSEQLARLTLTALDELRAAGSALG